MVADARADRRASTVAPRYKQYATWRPASVAVAQSE